METAPKQYSTAEAEQLLKTKFEIPGAIRSFLGHDNVRGLVAVMTDQGTRDMDILYLTGELTEKESLQYMKVLPDSDEKKRTMLEIADRMLEKVKMELAKCKTGRQTRKVICLALDSVAKLTSVHLAIREASTYRNLLLFEFGGYWETLIFEILSEYVQQDGSAENADFFKALKLWADKKTCDYGAVSQSAYLAEKDYFLYQLYDPVFRSKLESVTGYQPLEDNERKALKQAMKKEFDDIVELAQYRKISFTPFSFQDAEIAIMGEDILENDSFSLQDICAVELSLNPEEKTQKLHFVGMCGGKVKLEWRLRQGVVSFFVNRVTGELCSVVSHAKPISRLMSEDQYLALKRTVYQVLRNYLESKEPDIDDLFKGGTVAARDQVGAVLASPEPAKSAEETKEMKKTEAPVVPTWTYQPWKPIPKTGPDEEAAPVSAKTHARNAEYIRRLRGLRGNEVLAVLKRIMGEPARIQGSHHIFLSPRNSTTYPIPIHATESIQLPLLLTCLKQWGLTLEEFCNEI